MWLPPGAKTKKHKVFIRRMNPDRTLKEFRARLVACRYSCLGAWAEILSTFAPTVSLENVRMLLAMAAHFNWESHHVDIH